MSLNRLLAAGAVALALAAGIAEAQQQDHGRGRQQQTEEGSGIFGLIPADAVSAHVLDTASGALAYTATAGTLDLYGADGNRNARIFYTAYVAKDRPAGRPISFAFNGGPGAASAYLHLGLLGPKVVSFGKSGNDGTSPALADNPDSFLAFTDLVLIDPVGTGWSRAASEDLARAYWSVEQDAASLAKAITLYVQKNGRLEQPKYLIGESYGGFRAARVAAALKDQQGLLVKGVVMLSPLITGRFLTTADEDPLAAALQFPSLAAATLERRGNFSETAVKEAERFAMTEYLAALAGPAPSGPAAEALYGRIAAFTDLPRQRIAAARGFVAGLYEKSTQTGGKVLSMYDAAYQVPDAYPEAEGNRNDDPILEGFTRAYGGAFVAYARQTLGFACELTYELLNSEVNRRWQWNGNRSGDGRANADASGTLRDLFAVVPGFRLLIAHGYADAITPFGASRYVIDHLPPGLAAGRATLKTYRGGHMFYTDPAMRAAFARDARAFFEGGATD